eukprot:13697239-Alexandrium_andersonii.AAC.1
MRALSSLVKIGRAPKSSPGGRGPSSPDGPNGPLRASESAEIRSPHNANASASGACLWKAGLQISADSEPWRG